MAATTTSTTNLGGGADDRVMAAAQQIVKSLNTSQNVREDMLLIFSKFDNRLSNITKLVQDESIDFQSRLDAAERIILGWDSGFDSSRHSIPSWEDSPGDPAHYLSAVDSVLDLLDDLSIQSDKDVVDRAANAVNAAMTKLEEEFYHILIRNTVPLDADRLYGSIRRLSLSFVSSGAEIGEGFESFSDAGTESGYYHERGGSLGDDVAIELVNCDAVADLKEIADRMIRSGYEKECVQVYSNVRRDALDDCLVTLGVEKLSIEEVQKIEWKSLDEKMKKWVQAVKIVVRLLLREEKSLCDQLFSLSESEKEICFCDTTKGCVVQLLNFGEAVSIARKSSEKLFRILDMYDALADVLPDLQEMFTDEFVCSEAKGVFVRLGEAAKETFVEFENAVQNEGSRKPMLNGEIHPLTRYVMNYIKLVVDYCDTLNFLLEDDDDESKFVHLTELESSQLESMNPLARRLLALLSTLELNLENKSRSYEDGGLQYVFLMNNILYVVQKVKDSELIKLLGDQWVRKRRGLIRQYATSYLRAAWTKALLCLKDEGIGGSSSNAAKVALKERFKNFNTCFEEIYRIQTGWKVPDPQLREELRISISEKVIPAYRSFLGRFGSQLDSGRHSGKYIKYTAEDLENYLLDLFEGTPLVLHHLRRKNS